MNRRESNIREVSMGEKPTGATQEGADPGVEGGEGDPGSEPPAGRPTASHGHGHIHTTGA
jgi:hypothetical protein